VIVVDVNVIAYLWLPGELTPFAEKALRRDPEWLAPFLWRSEFRNILAGYLRRGSLGLEAARRCLEGAESHMTGHEFVVPSHRILPLLSATPCSAYDCEYAALALDRGVPLITADKQLLAAFPRLAVSLRAFAERR
jgi:predicted nucleic acid-binding protein